MFPREAIVVPPYSVYCFIAQYCAAKGDTWDTISLADMQAVLRQGKSSLYSYTRTSETRTVEDDDPDTEDVVPCCAAYIAAPAAAP